MLDQFYIVYRGDNKPIHFMHVSNGHSTICGHKATPSRWEAEVGGTPKSKDEICKKCLKVLDKAGLI